MAQMHPQTLIGNPSLIDMPFILLELVAFKVPPLVVHSVPLFNVLTDTRLLLTARLTPMQITLPPQDPLRPLPNRICLSLLTGVAFSMQP